MNSAKVDRTSGRPATWSGFVLAVIVGSVACTGTHAAIATMTVIPRISGSTLNVSGDTDLPDGSRIQYQIWPGDLQTSEAVVLGSLVNGELVVQKGQFAKSVDVRSWPPGAIHVWVAFDPVPDQPQAVIDRFGSDGHLLTGPDVVDNYGTPRLLYVGGLNWSP